MLNENKCQIMFWCRLYQRFCQRTENNFKFNKRMIFSKEDKKYHDTDNGKASTFRVGILKLIDSYNFMKMSLDKIANVYQVKSKTLPAYEYFKDE